MSEWILVSDALPDSNRKFRFKKNDGTIIENAQYSIEGNFEGKDGGFDRYGWIPGTTSYCYHGDRKIHERAHSWQYTDLDAKAPEPKAPVSKPLDGKIVIEALYGREIPSKPVEIAPDPLAKPRADFRHALIGGSILYIVGRILQHWM